jgi:hypothetical protein
LYGMCIFWVTQSIVCDRHKTTIEKLSDTVNIIFLENLKTGRLRPMDKMQFEAAFGKMRPHYNTG